MAISGAANTASKKLEGGSWKQALGAGAMGAGTSALGSALSGAKLKDLGKLTSVKGAPLTGMQKLGKGITAGLGGLDVARSVMAQPSGSNKSIGPSSEPQYNEPNGQAYSGRMSGGGARNSYQGPARNTNRGAGPRGLPYGTGAGQTPDLGAAFNTGRNAALLNQQDIRRGSPPIQFLNEETGMMEDMPGGGLPPIYPNLEPPEGNNMFGAALGGMMGIGGGRQGQVSRGPNGMHQYQPGMGGGMKPPGGGIGPSQPPMGAMRGAMGGGAPGPMRGMGGQGNNLYTGGGQRGGGAMQGLGGGMGGGSQYNAPGMGQFNPGMAMGRQRGGLGVGPSQPPMEVQPAQPMEDLGGPPEMGQKIDVEKPPMEMGMGIGPSDKPMWNKPMMNNQMGFNPQMQQPQMQMFGGRGQMDPYMQMQQNRLMNQRQGMMGGGQPQMY
jgi:hypothetical protein